MKAQKGLMEELASLHGRELAHQCQQQGTFPHSGHKTNVQESYFEITQLQAQLCTIRVFHSNTTKIHSLYASSIG